jgi:hypothetical protein
MKLLLLIIISHSALANNNLSQSLEKIKKSLLSFKENKTSQLRDNPLDNLSFDDYYSRYFIYGYKALANYLIAKNSNDNQQKLELLKKSLHDLNHAQAFSHITINFIEHWKPQINAEIIETSFLQKQYYDCINYIERATLKRNFKKSYLPFMAISLKKTNQRTRLGQLIIENKYFFSNHKDPILKPIQNIIDLHTKNETPSTIKKKKEKAKKHSWKKRLSNYITSSKQFIYLQENSEFDSLFKKYVKLKRKESKKQFVNNFENNIDKFPPHKFADSIRTLWKKSQLSTALLWCKVFATRYWGHPDYPQILYYQSRLLEDLNQHRLARKKYDYLISLGKNRYQEVAMYRIAWLEFLQKDDSYSQSFKKYLENYPQGKYETTSTFMATLAKDTPTLLSNFFTTKTFTKTTHSKQFTKQAQKYIEKFPLNFYSVLLSSYDKNLWKNYKKILKSSGTHHIDFEKENPFYPVKIKDQVKIKIANELKEIGLKEHSSEVLELIDKDSGYNELLLHNIYRFQELNHQSGVVINSMMAFTRMPEKRKYINVKNIFPKYQFDLISNTIAKNKTNLSPFLVLSLIRQESAFNHKAISPARAYGLMQIIKSTARQVAKSNNVNEYNLFKKEDNINLGTNYLAQLLKDFDNNLIYALASYNAGPHNAKAWIKARGHLDPISFIETIPFAETQSYVKLVLRNFLIYEIIYNDLSPEKMVKKLALTIKQKTQL